ncbi:hypothetical protein N7462_004740 [Penicillium macrosclerotiorum]|uniref:uncharacterized protein n=1 Tax=Penicillium macrosclerotiorum TaxID=303699 RepID=UPI0025477DBE|nr:uncharacterized protein N7462_004740 [Penicillium macrosclerotiorum]KAJ5690348.1 hypothetical protein N7462_004740 [Penicillium macrosclerotiorum]
MQPSKENIAEFLAFTPGCEEGTAFMFLENANTLNEAVDRFYENPDRYSHTSVKNNDLKPQKPGIAPVPPATMNSAPRRPHMNALIQAELVRARDEQEMQNMLQTVQLQFLIYNSEIEPEHDTDFYCSCQIHQYKARKMNRLGVHAMWCKAVMYPGEKVYHDCYQNPIFTSNPYLYAITSPYGLSQFSISSILRPDPHYHARSVHQTIELNAALNVKAQASINAQEPKFNIWEMDQLVTAMSNATIAGPSKLSGLKRALSIKSSQERAVMKSKKEIAYATDLRTQILQEEVGRWPDQNDREIVATYQAHVGMTSKIADLRARFPIQYFHLLRAGYFEPIPVAWATLASNPLKFSIEARAGWRGITPTWRGFEDTAEERLYWVLNHREGGGARLKPDMISALNMARARMASAVEPPPAYYAADDTCHVQHTSKGYSRQVMPPPFIPFDRPETPADDTMILLDVSGSMDFDPVRPNYVQYLITGFSPSTQPKNKDVAKAIIRRFTDAMANHDHNGQGYQLTTFSSYANYVGVANHRNLDELWRNIRFGGGTRVMTGWQKVKELHFQKHSASATYHPIYGWQAGPETPILRLLLLLDGEATDMDEFELDLLSLSWVHVTIFLIGVDGCPHHHRHANELQRISDVNHHVSFVDAQGNAPERFITHELLKRHLGYELSMSEFEDLEQPPPYSSTA